MIEVNNLLTYIPNIYKDTTYEKDNTYYLNQNLVIQIEWNMKDLNVDGFFKSSSSSSSSSSLFNKIVSSLKPKDCAKSEKYTDK